MIYGDGSQTRDFTYVANVVAANLLADAGRGAAAGRGVQRRDRGPRQPARPGRGAERDPRHDAGARVPAGRGRATSATRRRAWSGSPRRSAIGRRSTSRRGCGGPSRRREPPGRGSRGAGSQGTRSFNPASLMPRGGLDLAVAALPRGLHLAGHPVAQDQRPELVAADQRLGPAALEEALGLAHPVPDACPATNAG